MLEVKRLAIMMLAAVLAASAALSNVAISRNSTSDGVEYFTQEDFIIRGKCEYLRCKLGFIKQGGKEYIAFRYENGGDLSVMYETLPFENALVACYQNGVYYYNVNPKVEQSLSSINFKPKYVKFTDKGLLLITDGVSQYTYFL